MRQEVSDLQIQQFNIRQALISCTRCQQLRHSALDMLATSTIEILRRFYTFTYFMGVIPFKWNSALRKLQLTTSKWKRFHCHCVCAFSVFYPVFMGLRIVHGVKGMGMPGDKIVYSIFTCVCWSTVGLFNINTMLYQHEVDAFINHFIASSDIGLVNNTSKPK